MSLSLFVNQFISHTGCPLREAEIISHTGGASSTPSENSLRTRGVGSPQIGSETPLLVRVDWRFILGFDFIAISPLPVVVAVVVDLLDRDRRLRRDVIREVVGTLVNLAFL